MSHEAAVAADEPVKMIEVTLGKKEIGPQTDSERRPPPAPEGFVVGILVRGQQIQGLIEGRGELPTPVGRTTDEAVHLLRLAVDGCRDGDIAALRRCGGNSGYGLWRRGWNSASTTSCGFPVFSLVSCATCPSNGPSSDRQASRLSAVAGGAGDEPRAQRMAREVGRIDAARWARRFTRSATTAAVTYRRSGGC